LAMQPPEPSPGVPVFDTETLGVTVYHHPPSRGLLSISDRTQLPRGGSRVSLTRRALDPHVRSTTC
jgi:hypothetical protein